MCYSALDIKTRLTPQAWWQHLKKWNSSALLCSMGALVIICPAWRWSCASCFKEEMNATLPLIQPNIWHLKLSKPSQWTDCFLNRILAVLIPTGTRINSNCSELFFITVVIHTREKEHCQGHLRMSHNVSNLFVAIYLHTITTMQS